MTETTDFSSQDIIGDARSALIKINGYKPFAKPGLTPPERSRYVADLIEAHPEHFDMRSWVGGFGQWPSLIGRSNIDPDETDCGTTACIGGWTMASAAPEEITTSDIMNMTRDLLGLDILEPCGEAILIKTDLTLEEAVFLLRWHADLLDQAEA